MWTPEPFAFAFPFACLAFFVLGLILCWAFGKLESGMPLSRTSTVSLPVIVVGVEPLSMDKSIQVDLLNYSDTSKKKHLDNPNQILTCN